MALDGIPNSVKTIVGGVAVIAAIISSYKGVEAWADGIREDTAQQIAVSEAKQSLIHDQQFQTNRLESNEAKLRLAELELAQLEDDAAYEEVSARDARAIERLQEQIELYEEEIREARKALREMEKRN